MKFGKTLLKSHIPEWTRSYISYKGLKKLLKNAVASQQQGTEPSEDSMTAFFFALDRELERINSFYLFKRGEIERQFRILADKYRQTHHMTTTPGVSSPTISPSDDPERDVAFLSALLETKDQISKLLWFAEMNKKGFMKILKKFDKKLQKESQTLYMNTKVDVLPFVSSLAPTEMLDSLEGWIKELSQRVTQQERNGFASNGVSRSTPHGQRVNLSEADTEVVQNALDDDDPEALGSVLDRVVEGTNPVSPQDQKLFTFILLRACQHKAYACITLLMDRDANIIESDGINERSLLHRLAIHGGSGLLATSSRPTSSIFTHKTLSTLSLRSSGVPISSTSSLDLTHNLHESDDADLITFILQRIPRGSATSRPDILGRCPLHYAAINGYSKIARTLLAHMVTTGEFDKQLGFSDPKWYDNEGLNPMFYAVLKGHAGVVEALIEVGGITNVDTMISPIEIVNVGPKIPGQGLSTSSTSGSIMSQEYIQTPLAMACKLGHTDVVGLLIRYGAKVDLQDSEGETALHVAARGGFVGCVKLLVKLERDGGQLNGKAEVNKEIKEKINGWTPLMIAAIEGHLEIVQILISTGSNVNTTDFAGWTAHEHSVFRGHVNVAKLLKPLTAPYEPPPILFQSSEPNASKIQTGRDTISAERAYGHRYLQGQSMIVITLGSNNVRCRTHFVHLNHNRHSVSSMIRSNVVSLVVSATHATGEPITVDLPVGQDGGGATHHPESVVFLTTQLEEVVLRFDILPTYGSAKRRIVGRATALLASDQMFSRMDGNGKIDRVSLRGQMTVPIVGAETLENIGSVSFEYVVVKSFEHLNMSIGSKHTYWKSLTTQVIGHRGLGMNRPTSAGLQLGENTVLSFVTAASLGAEYIEFDVQLTKDLVPVIYHDWTVTETGFDIPMNVITLEQFLNLRRSGHIKEYHTGTSHLGSTTKTTINDRTNDDLGSALASIDENGRRSRSNSLSALNKKQLQDTRAQFTKATKSGKLKGNGPGSIQAPFTTLKEAFKKVPGVAFNIEVKYPMIDEAEADDLPMSHIELNTFVDTILRCVYDHAAPHDRKVIFSSFHPEICLMLNFKQPNYPVFFLTDCGYFPMADVRCNSIQEAVRFAKAADLLGVVTASEPVLEAPKMVREIKETGLLLFTYGSLNNDVASARLQRNFGVDAVIVDSVMAVRRGLQE